MPDGTDLLLRVPRAGDAVAWHRLFDDPQVMRYIGTGLVRELGWYQAFVGRQQQLARDSGLCLFSVVVDGEVIGFAGVQPWGAQWGPTGEPEIGWRLGRAHWGRGRATTAARAVLHRARAAGVPHLVAVVHESNAASLALAHRLGMAREDLLVSPEASGSTSWGCGSAADATDSAGHGPPIASRPCLESCCAWTSAT